MKKRIVMKYGGASIAEVPKIKRVAEIVSYFLEEEPERQLIIVASAIGKTTNKLESVLHLKFSTEWNDLAGIAFERLLNEHWDKAMDLGVVAGNTFSSYSTHLKQTLENIQGNAPQHKDLVLSCGELLSTAILHEYFLKLGIQSIWADARDFVHTDSNFGYANVNWQKTKENFSSMTHDASVVVLQGFIGSNEEGQTTTLGREGSDFTAAIAGVCLPGVERVILWKDVKGIYEADPKRNPNAQLLRYLSPEDAKQLIESSNVVHKKTVMTLQKGGIPLQVRSFKEEFFHEKGTLIAAVH